MKIPFLLTFVFLWLHSGAFHWAPVLRHHHRSMQLLKPRWLAGHKMAHVPSCLYSCEYRSIHNKVTRTYSLDTDQCAEPTGPVARGVRRRGRLVEVLPRDAIIKEDGDQEPSDEDNGRADVIQTANEDEDELTGAGGAADENVVEENVPLSEPERFSRVFVATADIVDSELRDSAWDAHMQWIRRGCLDPDADFEVSWAMTGLDPACTEPRSQVLVLRANSSAPVAAALGVSSDLHRASEPLVSVGGVSEWAVFEASVDDELNVSMPVRAPHVFIGLFNTSCKDYDDSPLGEAHTPLNVVSNSNVALESGGRIGDSFVPELTPRAVAAEAARRAAESSLRRRLRLQREFHLAMSPHPPPPRADDGDSRDPYDLSSPLTEDADGDASPGGGYMEERASRAANDEAVGGFVSLFATLYSIRDEDRHKNIPTSRIGSDAAIGLSATMHAEARLPVGSFMVLNAASLVEARKYAGLDPLSGDMFAKPPRIFPANLQDTDGRHHLMGDTYYAQQELDAIHFQDPEDLLLQLSPASETEAEAEAAEADNSKAARLVAEWAERSGHNRCNEELLRRLEARGVSYRYERLPPPEELLMPDEDPQERARRMREAEAHFADSERGLRGEMRRVRDRRASDWPRLFDRDRDALPSPPPTPPAATTTPKDAYENANSTLRTTQ